MDRVRETLQLNFPEWYAAQKSQAPTDQHAVLLDDDLDDDENHHEFTVWSPWVLRPDGLAELFDEFEKNIQVCHLNACQLNIGKGSSNHIYCVAFLGCGDPLRASGWHAQSSLSPRKGGAADDSRMQDS